MTCIVIAATIGIALYVSDFLFVSSSCKRCPRVGLWYVRHVFTEGGRRASRRRWQ